MVLFKLLVLALACRKVAIQISKTLTHFVANGIWLLNHQYFYRDNGEHQFFTTMMQRRKSLSTLSISAPKSLSLLIFLTWQYYSITHRVCAFVGTIRTTTHRQRPPRTSTTLYGIKGFRKWFEYQFPSAITYIPRIGDPLLDDEQDDEEMVSTRQTNSTLKSRDTFDHVLIDMNQLLHTTMRRARSEGHALTMVLKELDYCLEMTNPTKSLVLAMDGSPGAGKLATQRRRRLGCVVRSQWKRKAKQRQKQWHDERINLITSGRRGRESRQRIMDHDDMATLCITPGTSLMARATNALYYYVWQRLSNQYSKLSRSVKVYISSADTPGEGEIKILDWINLHSSSSVNPDGNGHISPGDSIAIFGGDSDLVLEGLVLPPQITHNVFIIIPEKTQKHFCVSLWEVTRALSQFLPHMQRNLNDTMKLRMDLVLLLILNGNDYLPKLRGSAGFHKLFHTYLRLLKRYLRPSTPDRATTGTPVGSATVKEPAHHHHLLRHQQQRLAPQKVRGSHKSKRTGTPFFLFDGKKAKNQATNIATFNTRFALEFFTEVRFTVYFDRRFVGSIVAEADFVLTRTVMPVLNIVSLLQSSRRSCQTRTVFSLTHSRLHHFQIYIGS